MKTIYIKCEVPDWATKIRIVANGGVIPNIDLGYTELTLPTEAEYGLQSTEIYPYTDSQYVNNEQRILRQAFINGANWLKSKMT